MLTKLIAAVAFLTSARILLTDYQSTFAEQSMFQFEIKDPLETEFDFQNVHESEADNVEYITESVIPLAVSHPSVGFRSKKTNSQFKLSYCSKCNETKINCTSKIRTCLQCKTVLKYGCGKCTKLFKTFESLRVHLSQQCNKEPKFFCDMCDYKTLKKIDLTRHKKARHTFGD